MGSRMLPSALECAPGETEMAGEGEAAAKMEVSAEAPAADLPRLVSPSEDPPSAASPPSGTFTAAEPLLPDTTPPEDTKPPCAASSGCDSNAQVTSARLFRVCTGESAA